ncbi:MAG: periplasmic sensor hybrid histidine kinase [uncultured bacterium]|nr:MAG: periplasmic sensor hybrid histidine kinase [uncultured bacterium]
MAYKILIADDDKDLTLVMGDLLRSIGYETREAHEGIDVLELACEYKPNMILLDWNMPYGKGSAVMEMLMEKDLIKEIPIIVISGSDEPGMKETALKMGAKLVIRKPYETKDLLNAIQKILQP